MPRRRRLPIIQNGKCLLKLSSKHKMQVLKKHLGYMPVCYNRLTQFGLWAEVPAELGWEITHTLEGFQPAFWTKDLRVIDNWNDDENQIERWTRGNNCEVVDTTQEGWQTQTIEKENHDRTEPGSSV